MQRVTAITNHQSLADRNVVCMSLLPQWENGVSQMCLKFLLPDLHMGDIKHPNPQCPSSWLVAVQVAGGDQMLDADERVYVLIIHCL